MNAECYRWVEGSRFQGDANATGAALEAIRVRQGAITPQAVIEEARDPASPLHQHFDWDDARAAQRHRETVAHELVRSVVVRAERPATVAKVVVAKVTARRSKRVKGGAASSLLERGRGDLSAWIDRYEDVPELQQLVADVRAALRRAYGLPSLSAGTRRPAA